MRPHAGFARRKPLASSGVVERLLAQNLDDPSQKGPVPVAGDAYTFALDQDASQTRHSDRIGPHDGEGHRRRTETLRALWAVG